MTNGTRLFVADTTNNRVLIWNTIPVANQTAANLVLGQTTFTSITANAPGITSASLSAPSSITSNGTQLAVSDFTNNRVLLWNTIPTVNGQAANVVLGQALFTTVTANSGGIGAGSISGSRGVYFDGTKLFVADSTNQRILIWNTFPTTNFQVANETLGQFNFLSNGANMIDAKGMNLPQQGFKDINGKLYVADTANNRVLIWYTAPINSDIPADVVLGQSLGSTNLSNNG